MQPLGLTWVGSDQVWAQPTSDPTRSGGRTFNPPPTERMIGSDGLEHQRVVVGSVRVKIQKIDKIWQENDENRPRSRLDLVKSRQNQPRTQLDLAKSCRIQPRSSQKTSQNSLDLSNNTRKFIGWLIWVSRILKKENRRLTLQSQVLDEAIRCQPLEKLIWSVVGQVQSVVAGGSGLTIDQTTLATTL